MNDWQRVRGIVEEAIGIPAGERDLWLDRACAGDTKLRDRAQRLVDAALKEDAFLRPPPAAPLEGERIGPYRLLRRLASGGMGTVYLAERDRPHRRVALKLMRSELIGADAVARFRYEVEVLASLQHPHIAAMYETGVREELPWFAMEFVEGARTIVVHAAAERLDVDARLELFGSVCDAVQHGHTKGVLHRDLKPDNLLVGRDGHCKVIDFGIARATDADLGLTTLRTTTGEILGTVAYMSPEQVGGAWRDVDTRSDVYALGVVLYELLTGELPYPVRNQSVLEAMRTICDDSPQRPSALRPQLKGDLETILLKCLAKDPDRRYGSVAALAEDLRRYRAREPIAARAPSMAYQVRTFARRNRALVGAVAAILVVSIAAALASTIWATRASRSAEEARVARNRARDATEGMRAERDKTAALFETLLDRSFETTHRHAMRVQDLAGGAEPAVRMTEDAIADLEKLREMDPANRRVRVRLIEAYLRLGRLRGDPAVVTSEGRRDRSITAYRTAIDLARALHAEDPEDAEATFLHGKGITSLASIEEDAEACQKGMDLLESIESDAVDAGFRYELLRTLAYAHQTLGVLCMDRQDLEGGRVHVTRQIEILSEVAQRWPEHVLARFDLARCRAALAALHAQEGHFESAAATFSEALQGFGILVAEDPDNQMYRGNLAWNMLQLGRCSAQLADFETADREIRRAIEVWEAMHQEDPKAAAPIVNLCTANYHLGMVWAARAGSARDEDRHGHLEAARDAYRRAWQLAEELRQSGRKPPAPAAALKSRLDAVQKKLESE